MNWFTGILVYCMVWCVVFLTVLPFGVRRVENPQPGHETGAPEKPMLVRKVLAASAIAGLIFLAIFYVIEQDWISFRVNA